MVITFGGTGAGRLPTQMTYMGKTWQDEWGSVSKMTPPHGPAWETTFTALPLPRTVTVKTPHGGQVGYELANLHLPGLDTLEVYNVHSIVVTKRWTQDRGTTDRAEWVYNYQGGGGVTTVQGPTGITVEYVHEPGTALVSSRKVRPSPTGTPLDEETRTYVDLPTLHFYFANGQFHQPSLHKKMISSRVIVRNGRSYSTLVDYSSAFDKFNNYHHPSQITETGDLGATRTTNWQYDHLDAAYPPAGNGERLKVGYVTEEKVRVNTGQTFVKTWERADNPAVVNRQVIHDVETRFDSHVFGQPGLTIDANGNAMQTWHAWGQLSRVQTPGHIWKQTVNADGTIADETRGVSTANERTTAYKYDGAFRIEKVVPPQPPGTGSTGGRHDTAIAYEDACGPCIRTTTRGSSEVKTTFDGFGRPILTTNAAGVMVKTTYDAEGRVTFEGYPVPECTPASTCTSLGTNLEYDALGRVTRRTNPDGTFVTFIAYGPGTVTIRDEKHTEANPRQTVQTFEAFGDPDDARLVGVTDAANKTWTYTYNTLGKLTGVTAPDGKQRTWVYKDDKGWLETETHPESGTTIYDYGTDKLGLVRSKTDARGQTTSFDYDGNSRVKKMITTPDGVTDITYEPGSDNRATVVNGDVEHHVSLRQGGAAREDRDARRRAPERLRGAIRLRQI